MCTRLLVVGCSFNRKLIGVDLDDTCHNCQHILQQGPGPAVRSSRRTWNPGGKTVQKGKHEGRLMLECKMLREGAKARESTDKLRL